MDVEARADVIVRLETWVSELVERARARPDDVELAEMYTEMVERLVNSIQIVRQSGRAEAVCVCQERKVGPP